MDRVSILCDDPSMFTDNSFKSLHEDFLGLCTHVEDPLQSLHSELLQPCSPPVGPKHNINVNLVSSAFEKRENVRKSSSELKVGMTHIAVTNHCRLLYVHRFKIGLIQHGQTQKKIER